MSESDPINIRCIDHVVLRVCELDRMIRFYCEVLGCRLERGPGKLKLAQLRAGQSLIDLVDVQGPLGLQTGAIPDRIAPNMDHFCLQIDPWDENAIRSHLQRHGVEADDTASRYGARGEGPSIYIRDPEGNSIELKRGL